jgi:signal transduction histidine kinase
MVLVLVLTGATPCLWAQERLVDSLERLLNTGIVPSSASSAQTPRTSSSTVAKSAASKKTVLPSVLPDSTRARILNDLAFALRATNAPKAFAYAEQSLALAQRLRLPSLEANAYNTLGTIYRNQRRSDSALVYFLKALAVRERIGDKAGLAQSALSIGNTYFDVPNYAKAREFYEQTLALRRSLNDRIGTARAMDNIAATYLLQGALDRALALRLETLTLWKELGINASIAQEYGDIGVTYLRMEQYSKALSYQEQAHAMLLRFGERSALPSSYLSFARIYMAQQRYNDALAELYKALPIAQSMKSSSALQTLYRHFALVYEAQQRFDSAFIYYQRFQNIRDSVQDVQRRQQLAELQTVYEVETKNKTIALLQREGELREARLHQEQSERARSQALAEVQRQELELSSSRQRVQELALAQATEQAALKDRQVQLLQREAELKHAADQRRQLVVYGLVLVSGLLLLLLVVLLNRFRLKQRSEAVLRAKNAEIVRQQEILEQQTVDIELANSELHERNLQLQQANGEILYQQRILEQQTVDIELANSELHERNAQLQLLNQEKNDLMGIVAHDLKNPLATIVFAASSLVRYKDKFSPDERLEQLHRIQATAQRMNDMVLHLLDMNALESGSVTLHYETFDMMLLVQEILEEQRPKAAAKEIALHCVPVNVTERGVWIRSDRRMAVAVLDNLVSNAVKYSPQNKNVFVRVQPSHKILRVEVQDEGPGISAEDMQKMFGKFARLSAQPTGGEHSTGLGLSIVKKLVEAMQGKVWCESELGKGATFIVELPSIQHSTQDNTRRDAGGAV